jgi:enoyl-CoA hydratase/carnithine racemase
MNEVSVEWSGDGRIGEVVLDRVASGNSLTPTVAKLLADAISETGESAHCVVLRTEGSVFCAGGDLGFLEELADSSRDQIARSIYGNFQALARSIIDCPVPVLARVQGGAAGAGCDIALACDLVVAGEGAWFEESWIRIGATSALAGALHLVGSLGRYRALELLLTGRRLSAAEAEQLGLVNRIVPAAELDTTVLELATAIAAADLEAVRAMKKLVRLAQAGSTDQALTAGLSLQADLLARAEFGQRLDFLRERLRTKRARSHAG